MTTTPAYTVPDDPADPEQAALGLIVCLPAVVSDRLAAAAGLTEVLQDYCSVLDLEGLFTGMSWHDAKAAASAICFDLCNRDDPGKFLRHRADLTAGGADNMTWDDRDAMVRAFTVAAAVLDR